jgi:hypothetical protein
LPAPQKIVRLIFLISGLDCGHNDVAFKPKQDAGLKARRYIYTFNLSIATPILTQEVLR